MHNKKLFFSAFLWTIVVAVLSLITIGDVGEGIKIPNKDKYVHFTFYFVFVVLWHSYATAKKINKKINLIVLFSAIGYGIFIEICQSLFTTTRTADVYDALANSIGAISGLLFITKIYNKKKATH